MKTKEGMMTIVPKVGWAVHTPGRGPSTAGTRLKTRRPSSPCTTPSSGLPEAFTTPGSAQVRDVCALDVCWFVEVCEVVKRGYVCGNVW